MKVLKLVLPIWPLSHQICQDDWTSKIRDLEDPQLLGLGCQRRTMLEEVPTGLNATPVPAAVVAVAIVKVVGELPK